VVHIDQDGLFGVPVSAVQVVVFVQVLQSYLPQEQPVEECYFLALSAEEQVVVWVQVLHSDWFAVWLADLFYHSVASEAELNLQD
jgi:hypothetical protein